VDPIEGRRKSAFFYEMMDNQNDYRSLFARAESASRSEFACTPAADTSIRALSAWISWLRTFRPECLENGSQFLATVRDGTEANPLNWCDARNLVLAPNLRAELTAASSDLSPFAAYALGRAAMSAVLSEPAGTGGLTLAYRMVDRLDQLGIGFAGCNDALSESSIKALPNALDEIDREIARLADDPISTARSFDREAAFGAVRMWQEAAGIEQVLDWRINEVPVELFSFANVLLSISRSAPEEVGCRIEGLRHPCLIKHVLDMADQATILKLLEHTPAAFDGNYHWLRRSAARLALDAFEAHCIESIVVLRSRASDEKVAEENAAIEMRECLVAVGEVLSKRSDGPRLTLEWLAHLLNESVGRESSESSRIKQSDRFRILLLLLNTAIDRFTSEAWAEPREMWCLYGADRAAFSSEELAKSNCVIPVWRNGIGRADAVTPVAVAALITRSAAAQKSRVSEISPWLAAIFNRLEHEPALLWLSSLPSSILFDVLAWPMGYSDDPAKWLATTWGAASSARLSSRFNRVEDKIASRGLRWDNDLVARKMDRCSAIIELGSWILRWISSRENRETIAPPLAQLLQDLVDEYRYCVPPLHVNRDSRLVAMLSVGMAVAGLLVDADSYARFVSRYVGDDDALVAAVSNTAANGVPTEVITAGLKNAGVGIHDLRDRWIAWQKKLSHEAVALSPAIEQLTRICTSAG
jgi:hypothetical protein